MAGRLLKPAGTPYPGVTLSLSGKKKILTVHRLVLEAFVGPRPPGMQCRHLNGDRTDSRLLNLAWGTARENAADRIRHGTQSRGERQPAAKLTDSLVREIRRSPQSTTHLASQFGVSPDIIRKVRLRRLWRHVDDHQERLAL